MKLMFLQTTLFILLCCLSSSFGSSYSEALKQAYESDVGSEDERLQNILATIEAEKKRRAAEEAKWKENEPKIDHKAKIRELDIKLKEQGHDFSMHETKKKEVPVSLNGGNEEYENYYL